jgi:hypothetical protein
MRQFFFRHHKVLVGIKPNSARMRFTHFASHQISQRKDPRGNRLFNLGRALPQHTKLRRGGSAHIHIGNETTRVNLCHSPCQMATSPPSPSWLPPTPHLAKELDYDCRPFALGEQDPST